MPWMYLVALLGAASCSDAPGADADAGTKTRSDGSSTPGSPNGCALAACPSVDDGIVGAPVSFRRDLMLPLQRNCSDEICHGSSTASQAGLYLGAPLPTPVDVSSVIARLVSVPSRTAPELSLVAPGDPARSFLLLKVEGCQNASTLVCRAQPGAHGAEPCGDTMPQAARPLCNAERDFLRRWVRQGASDN
jgi:hypothetical protein